MANRIYGFIDFIGEGTGALDKLPEVGGPALADKDMAFGCVGGLNYIYQFDADSVQAESVPDYIAPSTGSGRWVLQSAYSTSGVITTQIWNAAVPLTLSTDVITVSQTIHTIDTEASAASDDLVTINGGTDGQLIVIRAFHTDRSIVVLETGNILTAGIPITLDSTGKYLMLVYDGGLSKWLIAGGNAYQYTHPNHSGEVTSVGDGATTIANNAVTLAKLATQASDTFLANATSGAAVPTAVTVAEQTLVGRITSGHIADLSATQVRTLLNVEDGSKAASNTAYAASWDGVTDVAPSKNAVYDKVETIVNNLPNRNIIINGGMDVWQRGTSFTAPINQTYSADRWHVNHSMSDGVINVLQDTLTPVVDFPFQYAVKVDCTHIETAVASTEYLSVRYKMEGYDYARIKGQTCTLSFWVKAVKTGIYCVAFRNSVNDRSYVTEYTINSASTWEKKTVTLIFNSDGTWLTTTGIGVSIAFVVMCGTNRHTATTGEWVGGNYVATSNQVNGLDNTDNNFWLTGVQLEVGSVATPFEVKPYATELLACQRYCYALTSLVAFQMVNIGMATSPTVLLVPIPCPNKFRTIPTLTATAGDWIIYLIGDATGIAMTASSGAESMQWIDVTRSGGGMTTGAFYTFVPDDTVGRTLIFSAEL